MPAACSAVGSFFTGCSLFLISFVFIIISIYYLPYEGKRRTGWHGLYEMG